MGQHRQLISLEVQHEFFDGQSCRSIEFELDPGSQRRLLNGGLLVRSGAGRLSVFMDEEQAPVLAELTADGTEPFRLVWRMRATDPLLVAYTDPAPRREQQVLYFDSDNTDANKEHLHRGDYVSKEDFVQFSDGQFGEVITRSDRMDPPLAYVDLRILDLVPRDYRIHFDTVKTYWKYYLLGVPAGTDTAITDARNSVEFEKLGRETLEGGGEALVFRSRSRLPLRSHSDLQFQLREQVAVNGGKVLVEKLPVASPARLSRENINGVEAIVSDIFVNF